MKLHELEVSHATLDGRGHKLVCDWLMVGLLRMYTWVPQSILDIVLNVRISFLKLHLHSSRSAASAFKLARDLVSLSLIASSPLLPSPFTLSSCRPEVPTLGTSPVTRIKAKLQRVGSPSLESEIVFQWEAESNKRTTIGLRPPPVSTPPKLSQNPTPHYPHQIFRREKKEKW